MKQSIPPSKRGKSSSHYNTLANVHNLPLNSDGTIVSLPNGRKPGQVNRYTTKRQAEKSDRCNVMFFVFCHKVSKRWYVSAPKKKSNMCSRCIHNHVRLVSMHLTTPTKNIPPHVNEFIANAIKSGEANTSIQNIVCMLYNITLTDNQLKDRRKDYIDNMITLLEGENRNDVSRMNAATKLIRLFQSMDDVSFVYVQHKFSSGFVTFTKDRCKPVRKSSFSKTENASLAADIEIDSWRHALGLNDTDDILVSFAWAHDNELRLLRMFPEYLAIDGTFGLNIQKRSLLTVSGYDSSKKTFIGFRCFMPSKQKKAYRWAIGKAMPYLVGNAMRYNQVIACDMEASLVDAINECINDKTSLLSRSKLRSDYYHVFEQRWKERVSIIHISKYNSHSSALIHPHPHLRLSLPSTKSKDKHRLLHIFMNGSGLGLLILKQNISTNTL